MRFYILAAIVKIFLCTGVYDRKIKKKHLYGDTPYGQSTVQKTPKFFWLWIVNLRLFCSG